KGISAERVAVFKNLFCNVSGWMTLHLPLNSENAPGWEDLEEVTRLRLDMVNQAPGKIEIKEIRLIPGHLVKQNDNKSLAESDNRPETLKWNAQNNFYGWTKTRNCTRTITDGIMILNVTGKDHQLSNFHVKFNSRDYGALEVDYRMSGIPSTNNGEFYYWSGTKGISAERVAVFKNLFCNVSGWMTLHLPLNSENAPGWEDLGEVTRLRLDMVNQAPGKIEIKEIRLIPVHLVKQNDNKSLAESDNRPEMVKWNASNKFKGWQSFQNCKINVENGILVVDVSGRNSAIFNLEAKVPADKYNAFEVEYRASGLPENNNGEMCFAPMGGSFSDKRVWRFENIRNDKQWQTLRVSVDSFGTEAWLKCGIISHIRLGMVNQFPGRIEIKEIRFMPNLPELADSRMIRQARKFPVVNSPLATLKAEKVDLNRMYFSGYMLKSSADIAHKLPKGGARFAFKRKFTLDALPVKSQIHIGADDNCISRINGNYLGQGGSWQKSKRFDIAPNAFVIGENVLDGIYHNTGGPGGVYWELEMLMPDKSIRRIASDEKTVFAPAGKNDWTFPDGKAVYVPAELQTLPPAFPWRVRLDFSPLLPEDIKVAVNDFPADVESGKRYIWSVDISGINPDPDSVVQTVLETPGGLVLAETQWRIKDVSDGNGKLKIPVDTPEYLFSGEMVLKLVSSHIALPEVKRDLFYKNIRKKGPDFRARVRNGEVYFNGKRIIPFLGHAQGNHDYKGAGFHLGGVELRGFVASTKDEDSWWTGLGKYDFSVIDSRINTILSLDKNSAIIVYLPTTPPEWWGELNPEEISVRNDGTKLGFPDGETKVSFSSEKYRKDSSEAIEAFIRHMQSAPYSDRIAGYTILGGTTYEWIGWEVFDHTRFTDYSVPAQKAFAKYLKKYAPEIEFRMPASAERKALEFGYFINPESNRLTLMYTRFMSSEIADCIETFVNRARKTAGEEKLIGVYYGYSLMGSTMGKLLNGSHGELDRVLKIDALDYLLCPVDYKTRNLGDCGESGMAFAAIRAAGKMPVDENDLRTHLQGVPQPFYQSPDEWTTAQQIRRSLGRALSRNEMTEYYALTTGKEFSSQKVQDDFRTFRKAAKFIVDKDIKAQPEIAVVVSLRGYDYLADFHKYQWIWHWEFDYTNKSKPHFVPHQNKDLIGELVGFQRTNIAKIGAPVDYVLAENLENVIDRPYKLWIFLNQFDTTPEFECLMEKLRQRNVTTLFMYSPGVFRNDKIDFANMEKLTGIKLQKKSSPVPARVSFAEKRTPETALLRYRGMGNDNFLPLMFEALSGQTLATYQDGSAGVAMTKVGKSKSIFCGVPKLSADFLRSLAADAGVWIFSNDEDILFANDAFIAVHAAQGGKKILNFKKPVDIVDIFSREKVAEKVKKYEFDLKILETKIFYYGNEADKLIQYLKKTKGILLPVLR
ncbi:MAG: beta-galactosidase, partial [Lentisphaeria bacterium]|nr:beta-galactosidase [Lentisphaeria bacterium]